MGQYGEAAVQTALNYSTEKDLKSEWTRQLSALTSGPESIKKNCPRNVFLGLCEEGLIKNIPAKSYGAGGINKARALGLLEIAKLDSEVSVAECYRRYRAKDSNLPAGENGRADVVLSLLKANLIK